MERHTSFDQLWGMQADFYADRPLMDLRNKDPLFLLSRIEEEAKECREAIEKCMCYSSLNECLDLLTDDIRQEVSDLFMFVLALARNIGSSPMLLINDAKEKIARNMGRYKSIDFRDTSDDFQDKVEKSRGEDKRRGFTKSFYSIDV